MPPKRKHESSDDEEDAGMDPRMMGMPGIGNLDPNFSKKFLAKLTPEVRNRVAVLQALDKKVEANQAQHDAKVMELRRKYAELAAPIFAKRKAVITGQIDVTEEQVQAGFPAEHKDKVVIAMSEDEKKEKGIPKFWVKALSHHIIIDEMISTEDHGALNYLTDISYSFLSTPQKGFTLTFAFDENPYFTETALSKTFIMKEVNEELVLERCEGTKISWKEGKNLGVKTIQKKQKNKKGQVRFVNKEEEVPTFFDFFKTECSEEENEQYHAMAETIKDKMIPYAVEYFTGEADNGEDDLEEDDDDEMGDEEEEDDEEEEAPARGRGGRGAARGRGAPAGRGGQDCKQQ
jgi:nucleosome assembly protein 1-like 1